MGSQNSKCQVLAIFSFGAGGRGRWYAWVVKTQGAKFWPTFNFFWGWVGVG